MTTTVPANGNTTSTAIRIFPQYDGVAQVHYEMSAKMVLVEVADLPRDEFDPTQSVFYAPYGWNQSRVTIFEFTTQHIEIARKAARRAADHAYLKTIAAAGGYLPRTRSKRGSANVINRRSHKRERISI